MNTYVQGLLWMTAAAVVAGVAVHLVRRGKHEDVMRDNNEAAGQVFTIVGGLHAVLIAFVLISLFDGVNSAEQDTYKEADGLVAASWAAESLPEPIRTQVRSLSLAYADRVVREEWPKLARGDAAVGQEGWDDLARMRSLVGSTQAEDEWQNGQKIEAASKLWDVYQSRQQRLATVGGGGVSTVMWFALLAGSIMSITLPLMFGGPRKNTHTLIVSILAGALALLLFATYQLQNPYGGGAAVTPEAFESALLRLG